MAGVSEKLYPPTIGASIPAFYADNGTATIAVPFSMNRAVNVSEIGGFRLKIKTVQSNTFIKQLDISSTNVTDAITNRIAKFTWHGFGTGANDSNKIRVGQYLKIQLAYVAKGNEVIDDNDNIILSGEVGYFSTVGIIKYTSKPNVFIEGLGTEANRIEAFRTTYTGVYEPTDDKSERPYSYNFYLFNKIGELVETSGWLVHNTSLNNVSSESLILSRTTDTYSFNTMLDANDEYHIQYGVRTINNLEVFSPMYSCIEPYSGSSDFHVNLVAENMYEDGYVALSLEMEDGYTLSNTELQSPVSLEFCRSEKTDNFSSWQVLKRIYFSNYEYALEWTYKDFTIEQGITYKYCFRQYNANGIQSERKFSNEVFGDFEDMFLWDGKRQLKIRFNPKVSSFKTNILEQKVDTIGSKYPFIFRNGIVEYKEFPISGLISYLADNNELFINHEEDLNIILGNNAIRQKTPVREARYYVVPNITAENYVPGIYYIHTDEGYEFATEDDYNEYESGTAFYTKKMVYSDTSYENSETLDSIGYNMRAERRFKLKLLEWLGNGEIKMFKSAAEGNYLVRLLNISLSPEDKLGRMLHTFSATAYEVEELNYNNLVTLGFLDISDDEKTTIEVETVKFIDKVNLLSNINTSVLINNHTIQNYMYIQVSPNVASGAAIVVRLGSDSSDNKTFIHNSFILNTDNSQLPNIYFNISDNAELIREELNIPSGSAITLNHAKAFVADAVVTYKYYKTSAAVGDFQNINNVYIRNEIQTLIGPRRYSFNISTYGTVPQAQEVLKFFVLNFKKKAIVEVVRNGNTYRDKASNAIINRFDVLSVYKVYTTNNNEFVFSNYSITSDGSSLASIGSSIGYTSSLIDENNYITTFNEPPILNLNEHLYREINLGNGMYAECAYQLKITDFNNIPEG